MKNEFKIAELKEKRKELKFVPYFNKKRHRRTKYDENIVKLFHKNYSNQKFSLPKTIMNYIVDNISAQTSQKFNQTCKYFFFKNFSPIIHRLYINPTTKYVKWFTHQHLLISSHDSNLIYCKNAILSNSLQLYSPEPGFYTKLVSNLKKSEIKYFKGKEMSKIKFSEFEFLIGHGNAEICWTDLEIRDEKEELISIEDLVKMFPNARKLR